MSPTAECAVPSRGWRHQAKVKLGPTGSFGRDALRRVLGVVRDVANAECDVPSRGWRHQHKVKLGPTGSFGGDAFQML